MLLLNILLFLLNHYLLFAFFQTHWTMQSYSTTFQISARAQATQYKVNANLLWH